MPNELVPIAAVVQERRIESLRREETRGRAERVLERWLNKKATSTRSAYERDIKAFSEWLDAESVKEAVDFLLEDHGRANATLSDYAEHLLKKQPHGTASETSLSTATVNRYVRAVKAVLRAAHKVGAIDWQIDVDLPAVEPRRDTRGPEIEKVAKLLDWLEERCSRTSEPQAFRDSAMIQLMAVAGLRRGEVSSLDVSHVGDDHVKLLGKGRRERETAPVPPVAMAVIQRWITVRSRTFGSSGALFVALDVHARAERLQPGGIWRAVRMAAEEAKVAPVWPHALRHFAVTAAWEATDLATASSFARHKNVQVTMRYLDSLSRRSAVAGAAVEQRVNEARSFRKNGNQVKVDTTTDGTAR